MQLVSYHTYLFWFQNTHINLWQWYHQCCITYIFLVRIFESIFIYSGLSTGVSREKSLKWYYKKQDPLPELDKMMFLILFSRWYAAGDTVPSKKCSLSPPMASFTQKRSVLMVGEQKKNWNIRLFGLAEFFFLMKLIIYVARTCPLTPFARCQILLLTAIHHVVML